MNSWKLAREKADRQQIKAHNEEGKLIYLATDGNLYHVDHENGNLTKYTDEELNTIDNYSK